jgi:D-alanyl-D-alanine dipeptidase
LPFDLISQDSSGVESLPNGFVDVREVIPSVVLELRYFDHHNFVGKKIDGYHKPRCVLTREAAQALAAVQEELLKFSLSLKIYDAYRPQRAVDHFVHWVEDLADTLMKKEFYPTVDKKNLFRDGYVAKKSSHSRGSTVDLTIVPLPLPEQQNFDPAQVLCPCYKSQSERFKDNSIDMGSGYDCFHPTSNTVNQDLSPDQRINRLLLKTLMEKHGFRNYPKEWWHYTLIKEPYPDTHFNFQIE